MKKVFLFKLCLLGICPLFAQWQPTGSPVFAEALSFFSAGDTLYAGIGVSGVYRSLDNGDTWTRKSTGLPSGAIYSLARIDSFLFAGVEGRGVYRSANGGDSWTEVNAGLTNREVLRIGVWNRVLFAVAGNSVYYSQSLGASWQRAEGMLLGSPTGLLFNILLREDFFLATGSPTILKSTDGGRNWREITTSTRFDIRNITANRDTLFFGATGDGLWRSDDAGETWSQQETGLGERGWNVSGLLFAGPAFYMSTETGGVFYSEDGGRTWTDFNDGLPAPEVRTLGRHGNWLLVATPGNGIWRRRLTTTTARPPAWPAEEVTVYPNPAKDELFIRLSDAIDGPVRITLTDIGGRVVLTGKRDAVDPLRPHRLDLRGLAPGTYLCRLVAREGFVVRKLMIAPYPNR